MDILIMLIIISLGIAVAFLWVFLWNLRSGQYDDTTTPAIRMLFDEPADPKPPSIKSVKTMPASDKDHTGP